MDVQQAIRRAKAEIANVFGDEEPTDIALEEVRKDERSGNWLVTIGFARPWGGGLSPMLRQVASPRRTYKVVEVEPKGGEVLSITHRTFEPA